MRARSPTSAKLLLASAAFVTGHYAEAQGPAIARSQTASPPSTSDPEKSISKSHLLNFQSFKTDVQPIFLKERPGHARCYGCHSEPSRIFHIQKLSPGEADWTEEQSRQNFQSVLDLVVPGEPGSSPLLLHPLAPSAGGDPFHSGGWQFPSQNDPDWLTLADWVRGLRVASQPVSTTSSLGMLRFSGIRTITT